MKKLCSISGSLLLARFMKLSIGPALIRYNFLGIHNESFLYYSSFFIGSHFETSLGTGILQIGLLT